MTVLNFYSWKYLSFLKKQKGKYKMALKVGDKAPDFTLKSFNPLATDPQDVTLSSYKDQKDVLLLFFPQAFTGVCTDEMCTMSEGLDFYNDLNVQVLGISVDGTFVQRAFAEKNNIKVPLLSDYNREVAPKYGVLRPEFTHGMKNTTERAVFLIDKTGTIQYVEVTATPGVLPNFNAIREKIQSLN
jgi:peroxiredoxin